MINQHQTIRDNIAKYNRPNRLADFLIPLIGDEKEVYILDVGSGPYSIIGSYLEGVEVDIMHMDNQDFTEFYRKYDMSPIVPIFKGDMENLNLVTGSYDIVTCINALDHTNDAAQAVKEMIRVCKPGGYIYIDCHLDQKDTGHKHKWNAREDGVFTNGNEKENFDLKYMGFDIKYIDNGGERRYNRIVAVRKV